MSIIKQFRNRQYFRILNRAHWETKIGKVTPSLFCKYLPSWTCISCEIRTTLFPSLLPTIFFHFNQLFSVTCSISMRHQQHSQFLRQKWALWKMNWMLSNNRLKFVKCKINSLFLSIKAKKKELVNCSHLIINTKKNTIWQMIHRSHKKMISLKTIIVCVIYFVRFL